MTKITAAERVFLSRAEAVTEKKRTRAAHYEQQLQVLMAELQPGDMSKLSKQILKRTNSLARTAQTSSPKQEIADAVREAQLDNHLRRRTPYADPYNQLELLNETLKKLDYQFKHCDDPSQLCKLANAQVRVVGAMHVINEKLERKHHKAIQDAAHIALNAPMETK